MAKKKTKAVKDPVRAELPRCSRCGSTELKVVQKIGEQAHHGVGLDGRPYTSIARRRMRCTHCLAISVVVTRPFDPGQWRGRAPQPA